MLAFVRLDWDLSPNQIDRSVYTTMEELREQVVEAVLVFMTFSDLAERHMTHCLPPQLLATAS